MKEEYTRKFESRTIRIQDNRRIFSRNKEGVWRRRQRVSKSGRIKKIRVRKNNREIYIGV